MSDQHKVYKDLENINSKDDPWKTQHPYNQKTFKQLIELIKLVPHQSILEVGCGQGSFTKLLTELSKDVTVIDVSESAIKKASSEAKGAQFLVSSLENFYPKRRYDVIICAEILYYIKDERKAIEKLKELGDYLVTSQYVFCLPHISFGTLKYEWALRKFPLIKRNITTYHNPPTLTIRTVRIIKS
ncbi:MAG TPA: SAM-dependent methyltransferase [Candidatus Limnocylindrales bacterium]|nr:SAM-dependent methyltransferase [Candidatus Limnocylindrales bacterium]